MVKEVKDVAEVLDEPLDVVEDSTAEWSEDLERRRVARLTTAQLAESFGKWVAHNPRETFEVLLKGWIAARREMRLPVNPYLEDPEGTLKKPTKTFQAALQQTFENVRANKGTKR